MKQKELFILGIGPTKTGSTWLYSVLKKHPEVWMPPIKEINYFFLESRLGKDIGWRQKFGKNYWAEKFFIHILKETLKNHLQDFFKFKLKWSDIRWEINFFLGKQTDAWYKNLFKKGSITGDISPLYALLPETYIQRIAAQLPHAKIIIGLRDPVERVWSNSNMLFVKREGLRISGDADNQEMIDSFHLNATEGHNDYVALLERWGKYFPKDQIFVYYFDELQESPPALFQRICSFLEIEQLEPKGLNKYYNKGSTEDILPQYLDLLLKLNLPEIEKMVACFDSPYPQQWLEKYTTP
jgi:hypothetical protein